MSAALEALVWSGVIATALPTVWVALQIGSASARKTMASPKMPGEPDVVRPSTVVLVPAHDEETGIVATLLQILPALTARDRLLVVADNCSDRTAEVARAAGAEVVERFDPHRRGKGYALDAGVRRLESHAPEIVVVIDADCDIATSSLDRLIRECAACAKPVQARYDMRVGPAGGTGARMAAFAWVVKNHVRPLGLHRFGLPCQLMGTGMAFPWPLLRDAKLATGQIVEDLELGLDLAAVGAAPHFLPDALVASRFPSTESGAREQRTRWEQGHLSLIVRSVPAALWRAVVERRFSLAVLALDLAVPPLAVLMLLSTASAIVAATSWSTGSGGGPLLVAVTSIAVFVMAIGVAWVRFGRTVISFGELASAPLYIVRKLPLYLRMARTRTPQWIRTRRDGD